MRGAHKSGRLPDTLGEPISGPVWIARDIYWWAKKQGLDAWLPFRQYEFVQRYQERKDQRKRQARTRPEAEPRPLIDSLKDQRSCDFRKQVGPYRVYALTVRKERVDYYIVDSRDNTLASWSNGAYRFLITRLTQMTEAAS